MTDGTITTNEIMEFLHVKKSALSSAIRRLKIPVFRCGKRYLVTESDWSRWLERQKEQANRELNP